MAQVADLQSSVTFVSETYIRLLSSPTTTTASAMSVPEVSAEHLKNFTRRFHQDNVHRITHCATKKVAIRESLARVNATSTRTAEVTISIALDSYRIPSQYEAVRDILIHIASGKKQKQQNLEKHKSKRIDSF